MIKVGEVPSSVMLITVISLTRKIEIEKLYPSANWVVILCRIHANSENGQWLLTVPKATPNARNSFSTSFR